MIAILFFLQFTLDLLGSDDDTQSTKLFCKYHSISNSHCTRGVEAGYDNSNFISFTKGRAKLLKPGNKFCRPIPSRNILMRSSYLIFFLYRRHVHYVTAEQCQIVNRAFTTKFKGRVYSVHNNRIIDISSNIFSKKIINDNMSNVYFNRKNVIEKEIYLATSSLKPWRYKPWKRAKMFTIGNQSNWVYQRDCIIQPHYVNPQSGKTNLQLMKEGRAPISIDGFPVNLHHTHQTPNGAIAEVTSTFHIKHSQITCENHGVIPSLIKRECFRRWRTNYWKMRYSDFVDIAC